MLNPAADGKSGGVRNKVKSAVPILVVLLGILLLLYPMVSNMLAEANATRVINDYKEAYVRLSDEDRSRMLAAARDWNKRLAQSEEVAVAPGVAPEMVGAKESSQKDLREEYWELLDSTGDAVMGYVTISKLGVQLPIYHGTSEEVIQAGVGHLEKTSLPVGGASTHAALSSHRGLPSARLFTDLDQMQEGDRFCVNVLGENLAYEVDKISVVLPDELEELEIQAGADLCTLITCTPYGVNSHRLLVRGHRVPYVEEENQMQQDQGEFLLIACGVLALVMVIAFAATYAHRKKKGEA